METMKYIKTKYKISINLVLKIANLLITGIFKKETDTITTVLILI